MAKLKIRNIDDSTWEDRSPYVRAYHSRTETERFEDWAKTVKDYTGITITRKDYKKMPKGDPWFPPY